MNNTKLMDKLFSEGNDELKTQVTEKIEEAKQNGSSELITDDENLKFADTGDGIVVEDQANDNEVTLIKENPENPEQLEMEAVDVNSETKTQSEETEAKLAQLNENAAELAQAASDMEEAKDKEMAKAVKEMSQKIFSDTDELMKEDENIDVEEVRENCKKYSEMAEAILNAPDVQTPVVEGKDGEHIQNSAPEVKVEVSTGIDDSEKAGLKKFSLTFTGNCDPAFIASVSKAFTEVAASPEAEPAKDPENNENYKLEDLQAEANKIADDVKTMKESSDKELAKSVKEMSQKLFSDVEKLEVEGEKSEEVAEIKNQCSKFSEEADEVINKEDQPKEDPKPEETPEVTEEEAQKNFSACLGTSFNGVDVAPRKEVKTEQKTFSVAQNKEGWVNPCLSTKIN